MDVLFHPGAGLFQHVPRLGVENTYPQFLQHPERRIVYGLDAILRQSRLFEQCVGQLTVVGRPLAYRPGVGSTTVSGGSPAIC